MKKPKSEVKERTFKILFSSIAAFSILAVLVISIFIFVNAIPALREIGIVKFLMGQRWAPDEVPQSFGILPMIVGSLVVTAGAILLGVPIGILTAVYFVFYCKPKLYKYFKVAINLLAGIPSVVYGLFGLVIIVPWVRQLFGGPGTSILAAVILLGLMILPTIVGISESAIRAVPLTYYEGAAALGETHEKSIFKVVLPAAKSGITASVILGMGRAIGETMAVIMVAGNQARLPHSILYGVRTLTVNIALEMGYATDLHRSALIATGAVLFVFILIINLSFSMIKKKGVY